MTTHSAIGVSHELLLRLAEARIQTDHLFKIIRPGSLYERPIPERHRIVFYVGHLEAFDWNLLRDFLGLSRFDAVFDQLFAFGIDPIDGNKPSDLPRDWPSFTQVEKYRARIRKELDSALADAGETDELTQLLNIAIEHRLMHAETLEYMFHQLPYESKVRREESSAVIAKGNAVAEAIKIPEGGIVLGLARRAHRFGWDNEFEAHSVIVPAFSIDKFKVTNGQFLEFVQEGGYEQRSCWDEKDWKWKTEAGVKHPVFWVPANDRFRYRSMFEEIPLQLDAPVFVSHAEASAYARWTGKTLPTEAEWLRAAEGAHAPTHTRTLWDPPPVGSRIAGGSDYGVEGLIGTGWEWTASEFAPFPGFEAFASYPGYSVNFFDGKHFVMKGGSTRTAACMLRKSFRNWFQAHYQYVYAGFRCVTR